MEDERRRVAPFVLRLAPYWRQVAGLLVLGSIAGLFMNTAVVLPAILLGHALDTALAATNGRATSDDVLGAAALYVLATAATEVPRIGKRWWLGIARARFRASVQADCMRGVLAWPLDRAARTPIGDVMARVVGDAEVLGIGIGELMVETWDTVLFSASFVVAMLVYDPGLTLASLVPVPLALLLAKAAGGWVGARTTASRVAASDLTNALHEQLEGLRVLRLFGRVADATARIGLLAAARGRAELAAIALDEGLTALYRTMLVAGVVVVIWQGGLRVASGAMTVGALVAFLQLFIRFVTRAPRIPMMANRVQAAGAAYRRLEPLLASPARDVVRVPLASFRLVTLPEEVIPPPIAGGRAAAALHVEDLSFAYPGSPDLVLRDVTLEIAAGSLVAVTGPVGAGKSALAMALAGLWPPRTGRILLDGAALQEIPSNERARRIGYLDQAPRLFSGSIAENIGLTIGASELPQAIVSDVLRLTSLDADLALMPDGLATWVGERGITVSGGQRQRIALARSLVAPGAVPGVLVLDDPFSAVDVATEAAIVAALRDAFGPDAPPERRATIVLFSHRLAAFPRADQVVVLEEGRVRERGTHRELVGASGLYARIFRAQERLDRPAVAAAGAE